MHSSKSHQFGYARAGCSAPKPMLAGLLFSGGGHCRTCLARRLQQNGSAACPSRQQLQTVDLSSADVVEILGSAFPHCSQLQQLGLSRNLRIMEQEAFLKCTSLQEVSTPPALLYMARCAFAGCTQLRAICKQGKSKIWRGTYARPYVK